MPWHLNGSEQVVCTGGCKFGGYVPCPVDHASQPPNDTWEGGPFFRCPECDWVIPDEFHENDFELAGMIPCPECEAGARLDTYDGPCELCASKKRAASDHTFPEHLHTLAKARFGKTTRWFCPQCFHQAVTELEKEYRAGAERRAFLALHASKPASHCDICGNIERLDVLADDVYVCVNCSPTWTPPPGDVAGLTHAAQNKPTGTACGLRLPPPAGDRAYGVPADLNADVHGVPYLSLITCPACVQALTGALPDLPPDDDPAGDDQGNPPGWYHDPEHDGYVRWWSGSEWAGEPTLPEHVMT